MKSFLKLKKYIAICCVLVLFTSIAIPAFAYDQAKAQEYADEWVFKNNLNYAIRSTADCTNFVSQCMNAGGFPQSDDWYYNNLFSYSASWSAADDLKTFIKEKNGGTLLGRWAKTSYTNLHGVKYYAYIENSSNILGFGSEIVFYDFNDDGKMNHAAIIVGTGIPFSPSEKYDKGDLVNAHTESRQHQYWHLDQYNSKRDTTTVYCYRLKV